MWGLCTDLSLHNILRVQLSVIIRSLCKHIHTTLSWLFQHHQCVFWWFISPLKQSLYVKFCSKLLFEPQKENSSSTFTNNLWKISFRRLKNISQGQTCSLCLCLEEWEFLWEHFTVNRLWVNKVLLLGFAPASLLSSLITTMAPAQKQHDAFLSLTTPPLPLNMIHHTRSPHLRRQKPPQGPNQSVKWCKNVKHVGK